MLLEYFAQRDKRTRSALKEDILLYTDLQHLDIYRFKDVEKDPAFTARQYTGWIEFCILYLYVVLPSIISN